MQITPLAPGGTASERRAAASVAQRAPVAGGESPAAVRQVPTSVASMRGGLRTLDPDLNRQVAAAQQALDYLERLNSELQGLKTALSGKLASQPGEDIAAGIAQGLDRFAGLWNARAEATGNSLDGQFGFRPLGRARQAFRVHGFDPANLKRGGKEILSFSVGGKQGMSALVEPGLGDEQIASRLRQALAPADIEVSGDGRGRLLFSTTESAWAELRDSFAVKGGGQRFADGQFSRVRVDVEPDAIQPRAWRADDAEALRWTLREVLTALDLVRQARDQISRAVAEAARAFDSTGVAAEQIWAESFTREFETMAERPRFHVFAAIAPALTAVSRHRVLALLHADH